MIRELTFDFGVRLSAKEMEAVQTWKESHGIASRSKAVRLLSMIGLQFSTLSEGGLPQEATLPFKIHLPADLHEELRNRSTSQGVTIGTFIIDQLRATTTHPPG